MRLAAIAFYDEGPVHGGFVRLGDVTALVGANDVGKTRLLRLIEALLTRPEECDIVDLFAVASPDEVGRFVDREAEDHCAIQQAVDDVSRFADVLELPDLAGGVRLGVSLSPYLRGVLNAFRYGACPADLDDELSHAVQAALEIPVPEPAFQPVKLEYLGGIDPGIFPTPVVVPSPLPDLVAEVGRVATRLAYALGDLALRWEIGDGCAGDWGEALVDLDLDLDAVLEPRADTDHSVRGPGEEEPEDPDDEPGFDWPPPPELARDDSGDASWRCLLDDDAETSHLHPAGILACQALQQVAAGLLPAFITRDYRLKITPAPPAAIARDDRVRVQLLRLDTAPDWLDERDGLHIDLDEVASGYRLWLELALRETLARVQTLVHLLYHGGRCLRLANTRDLDMPVDDVHAILRAAVQHLRHPRTPAPDPDDVATIAWAADKPLRADSQEPEPRYFTAPGARMYLIDEPEQRLHPGLQRRAARWLSTLMSEWDCQCVLATHTLAFVPTAPHTHAYQLTRTDEPDSSQIEPLDLGTLTPYSQLAQTVGLDRGELLTRWRAIIFAEPLLALILDQLASDQLHHAQIHLVPIPATDDRPPPEIALIADLTAAPLTLLTTTPPQPPHPDNRDPATPDTTPSATAVERFATELELDLEILRLPIAHPLDLLHPDAITQHTPDNNGRAAFPGHDRAHHLHTTTQPGLPYPDYLNTTYAIPTDPAAIHAITQTMREQQLPLHPQLTDALWHIEHIAFTADAT